MKKTHKLLHNESGSGLFPVIFLFIVIGFAITYISQNSDVSRQTVVTDARMSSYQNLVGAVQNRLYSETRVNITAANPQGDILDCTTIIRRDRGVTPPVNGDLVLTNDAFTPNGGPDNLGGMRVELDARLPINPQIISAPFVPLNEERPMVWYIRGGASVRDVRLYINERVRAPVVLDVPGAQDLVAAKGYIIIYPTHTGVGVKRAENRFYRIPIFLYYYMDTQYRLRMHSCFDPTSEAYNCTITGGAYNRTTRRCEPQLKCFTDNQGVQANLNCPMAPALFNQRVPMGHNGTSQLFSCLWCNQNPIQNELSNLGRARFFGEVWDDRATQESPFGNFNNLPVASPRNFSGGTQIVTAVGTCAELSYDPRCHPGHTIENTPTTLLHAWYRWNSDDGDTTNDTNYPNLPANTDCICRDYEARCMEGGTIRGVSFSGRQCIDAP